MNRIFTFLFIVVAFHGTCTAVDFAPLGAKWVYEFDSQRAAMKYSTGTITYTVSKDTTLGNIRARMIEGVKITPYLNQEQTAILTDTTDCDPLYAYSEGQKAYLSTDGGKTFSLYFDYSLSAGDKAEIGPFPSCNATTIEIDSIRKDSIGNKIYYFDDFMSEEQFILEQGGSKFGMWPMCGMNLGGDSRLKSYESGATNIERISSDSRKVFLYPNPVSDELNISSAVEVVKAEIYDSKGAVVAKADGRRVSLSALPHGVYSAVIILKDGSKFTEHLIR